jgi:hypothetical protein
MTNRKWKIIATIVIGVLLTGVARSLWNVFQIASTAERQTMSITYLTVATEAFIQTHRDWPRSWEDLKSVKPSVGQVAIPRDLDWVEKQVVVDFSMKLHEIAAQSPEKFSGFGPRENPYYNYPNWYSRVIEAARRITAETKPKNDAK